MKVAKEMAVEARDELARQVGFDRGPHVTGVVGISVGVGWEGDDGYCLVVDVTNGHPDLPLSVLGVPVRLCLCDGSPKGYRAKPQ